MAEAVKVPIRELDKYTMFTECPGSTGKRSRLAWAVRLGNPRITVYTNDPADTVRYGIISAPMNPETFFIFLNQLEEVCRGEINNKMKIECWTSYNNDDGSKGERQLLSELWFGKDADGIVWISVVAVSRPKIKFEFRMSDYHRIFKGDGTQLTQSQSSVLQALGVIKPLTEAYAALCGELRPLNPNAGSYSAPKPVNPSSPSSVDFDLDVF